jgi:hypothetical protein
VPLDGSANDHPKLLDACRVKPPDGRGSVLIIGDIKNPGSQRRFASQTPGAVAVEAVDLRELVNLAAGLDLNACDALHKIASFAEELMTNVGAADLINRTGIITRGTARREASATETAAVAFLGDPPTLDGCGVREVGFATGVQRFSRGVSAKHQRKSPDEKPGLPICRGCNMLYASTMDGCVSTASWLTLV